MIVKFNTATGSSSKGGSTLLWIAVIGLAGYLGYKFLIKPKSVEEENQ